MIVTSTEIDQVIEDFSDIIAEAINMAASSRPELLNPHNSYSGTGRHIFF